jgi:hypothetical protein
MPFTILAHQAPVLPLKRWRPALDGVALVVGSAVPDLARATLRSTPRFLFGRPLWWDGHTVSMQFSWSLPVGLVLTWLVRRLLAPQLAPYLPDLGGFHLRDLRHVARTRHRWPVIAGSVLIGSFSHIVLDAFTHTDRYGGSLLSGMDVSMGWVLGHHLTVFRLVQLAATVALSAVTVRELWRMGQERLLCRWSGVPADGADTAAPFPTVVRSAAALLLVGTGAWAATQSERGWDIVFVTWLWLGTGAMALLALVLRTAAGVRLVGEFDSA